MGRQESQLTGEVHVSLRPFASAPESSLQRSCPGCQGSERFFNFRSELHRLYDSTSVGSAGLALR